MNPKYITFFVFSKPYISEKTSFTMYETGKTNAPAVIEYFPILSNFAANTFESNKHVTNITDRIKNNSEYVVFLFFFISSPFYFIIILIIHIAIFTAIYSIIILFNY